MEKLEKFIYSVKYLPPTLYFGSIGLLGYDFYCDVFNETEFLNGYTKTPVTVSYTHLTLPTILLV